MRRWTLLACLILLCTQPASSANDGDEPAAQNRNYPVPPRSDKLLFYVQRTHNRNTVVYELNLLADGRVDNAEPLHASWIRYEEGGQRKELTYIQRRVYGLDFRLVEKDTWMIKFRQFKKRDIYLMRMGKNNIYKAMIRINGKMAELTNLFICSVTNSLGVPSKVKYIDINGIDPGSGTIVHERVIP